jgi:hypothetical protein
MEGTNEFREAESLFGEVPLSLLEALGLTSPFRAFFVPFVAGALALPAFCNTTITAREWRSPLFDRTC